MIKTNKTIWYVLLFLVMGMMNYSCRKKNFDDYLGKAICASDNFRFMEAPSVSNSSVNLLTQTQLLSASFNEEVPWTVVIRGDVSKSFKKFSGYGKTIAISWNGNPDTTVFFQAESCTVEFGIACREPVVETFTINTVNNFKNFNYLVYDGDGGGLALGPYTGGAYAVHSTNNNLNSPQGGNCQCITGNASTPQWYFGAAQFNVNLSSSLNADPSKVYMNCFVNVQGSTATIPVISLYENGTVKRDKYVMVTGNGWHYISFKLSDINVVNTRSITIVNIGLNAYPERATSGSMCVDFVSFTNDAPFISTK